MEWKENCYYQLRLLRRVGPVTDSTCPLLCWLTGPAEGSLQLTTEAKESWAALPRVRSPHGGAEKQSENYEVGRRLGKTKRRVERGRGRGELARRHVDGQWNCPWMFLLLVAQQTTSSERPSFGGTIRSLIKYNFCCFVGVSVINEN